MRAPLRAISPLLRREAKPTYPSSTLHQFPRRFLIIRRGAYFPDRQSLTIPRGDPGAMKDAGGLVDISLLVDKQDAKRLVSLRRAIRTIRVRDDPITSIGVIFRLPASEILAYEKIIKEECLGMAPFWVEIGEPDKRQREPYWDEENRKLSFNLRGWRMEQFLNRLPHYFNEYVLLRDSLDFDYRRDHRLPKTLAEPRIVIQPWDNVRDDQSREKARMALENYWAEFEKGIPPFRVIGMQMKHVLPDEKKDGVVRRTYNVLTYDYYFEERLERAGGNPLSR